ncbi:Alpha/Beta hydrolase protein [Lipomyces kononenkoae]|uniref:Alpha/Beta hydrolase protein n=1 Tax=Lipomyces kononenkoae TaxID=34357 RepID=A0ACC3SYC2_LIPKO
MWSQSRMHNVRRLLVSSRCVLDTPLFTGTRQLSTSRRPLAASSEQPIQLEYLQFDPSTSEKDSNVAPIIVLHGLLGSKQNNRSVCRQFAKELNTTVYALDLRNHGDSPHARSHDYKALALDVEHFIDTTIKKPSVILGHSMGAKTAMAVALRRPDIVESMIAVDNAPIDAALGSDIPKYVQALRSIDRMGLRSVKDAFEVLGKYEKSIDIRNFLLTNAKFKSDGTLGFRVALDNLAMALNHIAEFPFNSHHDRFVGSALFIRGTRSTYVPDEAIPTIGRFFPRFVLKDIDAGHWVISEKPAEFINYVEEFLRTPQD